MSPEERILLATIDCINEDGLSGTTIRRIAERAEVNQAAISYYYRGKDKLLELALNTTLENAFDLGDFTGSAGLAPRERLIHVLMGLIEGSLRYPGIARAHFYAPFMQGNYDVPAIHRLNAFMDELAADLTEGYRARNQDAPADLRQSLVTIVAATLLFTSTMPDALKDFGGFDLRDAAKRQEYIENVVHSLLAS